jgi:hypothetical protein
MSNPLYTRIVFFTFSISDISTIQAELTANKREGNAIFTTILGNERTRICPYA